MEDKIIGREDVKKLRGQDAERIFYTDIKIANNFNGSELGTEIFKKSKCLVLSSCYCPET